VRRGARARPPAAPAPWPSVARNTDGGCWCRQCGAALLGWPPGRSAALLVQSCRREVTLWWFAAAGMGLTERAAAQAALSGEGCLAARCDARACTARPPPSPARSRCGRAGGRGCARCPCCAWRMARIAGRGVTRRPVRLRAPCQAPTPLTVVAHVRAALAGVRRARAAHQPVRHPARRCRPASRPRCWLPCLALAEPAAGGSCPAPQRVPAERAPAAGCARLCAGACGSGWAAHSLRAPYPCPYPDPDSRAAGARAEPTSGLDSTTAMNLVASLCQLAAGGRAVITTIHQARAWGRVVQPDPTLMCLPARARPHASPGPAASLAHPAQGASLLSAARPAAELCGMPASQRAASVM